MELMVPTVSTLGEPDSVRRMHTIRPPQAVAALADAAGKKGVTILADTPGKRLIVDKTGTVVGIKAEANGKPLYVKARKGVVLTSGDFSASPEMLGRWGGPALAKAMPMGSPGNTGDGLKMAMDLGAELRLIYKAAKIEAMGPSDTKVSIPQLAWDGAVLVNKAGKRYVNESHSCTEMGEITVRQQDAIGYTIYDKNTPKAPSQMKLKRHKELGGKIFEANTVEELAKMINVPGVVEAVNRYNQSVEKGEDPEFGRTTLQGSVGKAFKIETPPFCAIPVTGGMYFSSSGVKTDEQARVVNWFGETIPHLYAAGQIRGRIAIPYHIGQAFVFGFIAGKKAAAEKAVA